MRLSAQPIHHPARYLLISMLLLLLAPLARASRGEAHRCAGAAALELDGSFRTRGGTSADYFEIEAPGAGLLAVEVIAPPDAAAEPKLAVLDESCRESSRKNKRATVVDDRVSGRLIALRAPGVLRFAVAAQNTRRELGVYKIVTRFVPSAHDGSFGLKSVEEPEPDPDPTGGSILPCPPDAEDDHADLSACATVLSPNTSLTGTLEGAWGDDVDVFSFALTAPRTVTLETLGETDTIGALYDGAGHRLAVDDDGGRGGGFRLVKTLAAGRYTVQVAGAGGAEGNYTLRFDVSPW